MFLKLDWGIIWPIVNIVVFYLLLRKFLFGPVSEVMEKRKKMISSDLDDAAQTKAEAEEIKQEYEKNLAQAKDEAGQIVSDARARAKNEYQNKMDQTKEEIALMRENARKDIEAEKQKTIAGLQTEIAGIALMAVAAWLGEVGKNNKMFFFPMVFMLAATLTSLVITVINKCKAIGAGTAAWGDWFQLFFAAAMAVLAIFLVVEGAQTFAKQMKEKKAKKAA